MTAGLLCFGVGAGTASAEVQSFVVSDPRDAPPRLDNGPNPIDIEQIRVTYDSAGSVQATVRVYEPWAQTNRYADTIDVRLGTRYDGVDDQSRFCSEVGTGDVTIIGGFEDDEVNGSLFIGGLEGLLLAPRAVSADGHELTFTVASPHLANRAFACATISLIDYGGEHCSGWHCSATSNVEDTALAFPPPPPPTAPTPPPSAAPACANGRDDDGDGWRDTSDPGCRGRRNGADERDPAAVPTRFRLSTHTHTTRRCEIHVDVSVTPDIKPERLFPFSRVELRVRGLSGAGRRYLRTRQVIVGVDPGYGFKVRPDRYRVSGRYLGDAWRRPTAPISRTVRVCAGKRR